MSETLIQVENLSKAYRVWSTPAARLWAPLVRSMGAVLPGKLRDACNRTAEGAYHDFHALQELSFELKRGEALGIIGRNGSGKSTLLQMLAGTLQPTTGSVTRHGRIAALLELGSGFNPEFTGRENVMLNGVLLGLTQAQIEERYASIVEFADIGEFIDQPVKTYSSGMMVRLAFAVAVSVEPEILIVDEALSVGDIFFQQKCFRRVHEMLAKGVSLLFVSHDTAAVQNLCNRAILLKEGRVVFQGDPEIAVSRYFASSGGAVVASLPTSDAPATTPLRQQLESLVAAQDLSSWAKVVHGEGKLVVEKFTVLSSSGLLTQTFRTGETMRIIILLIAKEAVADPSTGIHFYDRMSNLVFAAGTRQLGVNLGSFAAGERKIAEFNLTLDVQPGEYTFSLGCALPSTDGPNHGVVQHRMEGLGPISVIPATATHEPWPFFGIARLPLSISVHG